MRESSKPFQAPLLPPWRLCETKVRRDEEWSVSEWHFHCKGWGAPAELPGPHRSKVLSQHSLSAMQSGPLLLWLDLHRCIRHVPFEGKSHFRPIATCQSRPSASGILSTSSEILRSSGWPDVQVEVYATRRHIWGYSYELFLGHEHPEHHATSHLNVEVEHGAVFGFICIVSRWITAKHCQHCLPCITSNPNPPVQKLMLMPLG